jgi:hypothetical protein
LVNPPTAQSLERYGQFYMKISILYLILIIWSGTNQAFSQKSSSASAGHKTQKSFNCPTIVDILPKSKLHFKANSIIIANSPIEVIMPFTDTCRLPGGQLVKFYSKFDIPRNQINSNNVKAIVDTSQIISLKYDTSHQLWAQSSDTASLVYAGHPLFIFNQSTTSNSIELQDDNLIAVQEALDSSNQWRPIQIWSWSWCGNSFENIVLKPKHFAIAKIPCYGGNYFTSLRVKIHAGHKIILSNVYRDWIDYNQFTLPDYFKSNDGGLGFNLTFLTDSQ